MGAFLVCGAIISAAGAAPQKDAYVIQPGDGIAIRVAGYPEFNTRAIVPEEGVILMPLIGEVQAAGQTEPQLEAQIQRKLAEFIRGDVKLILSITKGNREANAGQTAQTLPQSDTPPAASAPSEPQPAPSQPPVREHPAQEPVASGPASSPAYTATPPLVTAYVIRPGDEIDLKIWGYPEFNTQSKVSPEGKFIVPLVGEVPAAGQTDDQVKETVRSKLGQYIKGEVNLVLSVTRAALAGSRVDPVQIVDFQKITVLGAIIRQESFPVDREVPLFELLSLAGGTTPESDLNRVMIVRNGKTVSVVNLTRAMETGMLHGIPSVKPGDTVFIPQKTHRARNFFSVFSASVSTLTALMLLLRL